MKKLLFVFITFYSALSGFSQEKKFNFISKDDKPINLEILKDGNHTYLSKEGVTLVLTTKKQKVTSSKLITPGGKEITELPPNAKMLHLCFICYTIGLPNGKREWVCVAYACDVVSNMNKLIGGRIN